VWLWTSEPQIIGDTVGDIGEILRMMLKDYKKSKDNVLEYNRPDPEGVA